MDRRDFFKGLLGAVVAGVAFTASQDALARALGLNKYAEMVRLQRDVIETNALMKTPDSKVTQDIIDSKMDHLFGYAMDHFTGDENTQEAMDATSQLFKGREFCDTLDEDQLREILEVVVPIAVARNLLAYQRILLRPKGIANWDRFIDKYKVLILRA